jgi:putative transposase
VFRTRKTDHLRIGRVSTPGARYFVTACTSDRRESFASDPAARTASEIMISLGATSDVVWLAGTVMPDHLHVVFELGARLPLNRVIAKLKGNVTRALRYSPEPVVWQENVFEHRLRPGEDAESYAFYVFMNPYCAGLCAMSNPWPWWVCTEPDRFRFLALRRENGSPSPEWRDEAERIAKRIVHRS